MTQKALINEDEIIRYYEDCQVDYELVWHLNSHMCMHYGYWTKETKNLREALSRMNQELIEQAGIEASDYVLDAGCGVGGSSIYLAKNVGCTVKGITLTPSQVTTSTENAHKHGVSEKVSFENQNYLSTTFEDNSFDVVWAIESVCYAWDKQDFLNEAFRVLKPGGRLIVADFYAAACEPGSRDAILLEKWTETWAIKAYAITDEFEQQCKTAGFSELLVRDATNNVLPSIRRLYYYFFPGIVVTTFSEFFGFRNRTQTRNTWSTYYQYKAYKKGLWRYNIISCVKPN
ncbi:methyltransferase domain-containing protein [Robiginitalea sp. IMCC44478]|uniref:methyltransferase domain-containing protein n=1 Tax=Robiginitalea sp. IMCC44478 TaxID=3459122 RepID=UPI004041D716